MQQTKPLPLGCRVVELPGLPSERYGNVIDYRPMHGRSGLFPVVKWDAGFAAFSSPEWGLKKVSTRLERLRSRIHAEFTHCEVKQNGSLITIKTPGAEFLIRNGKLTPYIPSPRYKALQTVVTEVWHGCLE